MIARQVADYLEDNSIGTVGTDIFVGWMGATPNDLVAIFDTGGISDDYKDTPRRTIQITTRDSSYEAGYNKAQSVFELLHRKNDGDTIGTLDVMFVKAMQEVSHIGEDENRRHLFTVNFEIMLRL